MRQVMKVPIRYPNAAWSSWVGVESSHVPMVIHIPLASNLVAYRHLKVTNDFKGLDSMPREAFQKGVQHFVCGDYGMLFMLQGRPPNIC